MWIVLALLSAVTAALVAVFGKLGLRTVDPTLATTVRAVLMAGFLVIASAASGRLRGFSPGALGGRDWLLLVAAAVAGALSWLCYFLALRDGPATAVAALDRLSLVVVVLAAALFLGEPLTGRMGAGVALMVAGAVLVAWR